MEYSQSYLLHSTVELGFDDVDVSAGAVRWGREGTNPREVDCLSSEGWVE